MSGIYDRIGGENNVSVHLLLGMFTLVAEGDVTAAQALAALQGTLTVPLDAAAITDLSTMSDNIAAASTVQAKLRYLNLIHAYALVVEHGISELTETAFRNRLSL